MASPPTLQVGNYVKLVSLSKTELNGRLGLIQSHDNNTGRYLVSLSDSRVLSLKHENLELSGANFWGILQDGFVKMSGDIRNKGVVKFAQDSLRDTLESFKKVLPEGVSYQQALVGCGVLFMLSLFKLGFMKAVLLTYMAFGAFVVGFPVFKSNGTH